MSFYVHSIGFSSLFRLAVGPPYTLRLKVKFYSSEPNTLREELTRYQFFLQLKLDLYEGRLNCSDTKTSELCALALQCKHRMLFCLAIRIDSLTLAFFLSCHSRTGRLRWEYPHGSVHFGISFHSKSNGRIGTCNFGGIQEVSRFDAGRSRNNVSEQSEMAWAVWRWYAHSHGESTYANFKMNQNQTNFKSISGKRQLRISSGFDTNWSSCLRRRAEDRFVCLAKD